MVSCIMVYNQHQIDRMIKQIFENQIGRLRASITNKNPDTLISFIEVDRKEEIWQMALELECQGLATGYGFGGSRKQAEDNAEKMLDLRLSKNS